MKRHADLPRLLEAFFTERLMRQMQASPHTIASYRDTFRLLLAFAQHQLKKAPSSLSLEDLDAPFISRFLDDLEKTRGNTARSRNVRLSAIRSFFRYASFEEPKRGATIQRVLAMSAKRHSKRPIDFLTPVETGALLAAPDLTTRAGRRDRALLMLAVQTGLRCAELIGLRVADVVLTTGAHVRCLGKGRKERCTPLRRDVIPVLRRWLREIGEDPSTPLFPSARGGALSHDGVQYLLAKHVAVARRKCASMGKKRVSPHVLRHTAAMDLLQNGVDRTVIALWLGHEKVETTQCYLDADLALKEKALDRTRPLGARAGRFRPDDKLLTFLKSL